MRAWFNRWRRRLVQALLHRRVFGERSQGRGLPHTRISPSSWLEHEDRLVLGDHVYIGPFNWIEAGAGVTLDEGVQVTSHVSIVTHSSHRTLRLMGRLYATDESERPGWIASPVHIGAYSFIGPHSLIEAGTTLGRGCIVCAGSVVRGTFGDHAVIAGNPARVIGDARNADQGWLARHPRWRESYEAWTGSADAAREVPTGQPRAPRELP